MPTYNLSKDNEAFVNLTDLTMIQMLNERVITKVFRHYAIPLSITYNVRAIFRERLRRMGSKFCRLGGKGHQNQLNKWKESTWPHTVNVMEVSRQ